MSRGCLRQERDWRRQREAYVLPCKTSPTGSRRRSGWRIGRGRNGSRLTRPSSNNREMKAEAHSGGGGGPLQSRSGSVAGFSEPDTATTEAQPYIRVARIRVFLTDSVRVAADSKEGRWDPTVPHRGVPRPQFREAIDHGEDELLLSSEGM